MITFPSSMSRLTGRIAGIACIRETPRPSDTVPSSRTDSSRLSFVSRRSPATPDAVPPSCARDQSPVQARAGRSCGEGGMVSPGA